MNVNQPQVVIHNCPCCGGPRKDFRSYIAECFYCGSMIQWPIGQQGDERRNTMLHYLGVSGSFAEQVYNERFISDHRHFDT